MPRRCNFKLELDFPQPLAGVDEAGCAPLAGPVVAGACILKLYPLALALLLAGLYPRKFARAW